MTYRTVSNLTTNQATAHLGVKKRNNGQEAFDISKILACIERVCKNLVNVSPTLILEETLKNIFDGISSLDIEKALILATIPFIEKDPMYNTVATRLMLQKTYKEVMGSSIAHEEDLPAQYRASFIKNIHRGIAENLFDARMAHFDLNALSHALVIERDELFAFMGIQTLHERYFMRSGSERIELPQSFWMRVAMGLAIEETDKNYWAIAFYEVLSTMRYTSGTPTLFHAGTTHPQLSSCYLTTVEDDLMHIFKCLGDNAQLSKWSGGVANDWTNLRATNATIKSINVPSQGVIPFLRIANDVTAAISRSGSRRGATVAYLETWHLDIEDFLDLRKNTGDERRRTHDMNTANWIPDLFMKRVLENGTWTMFSPSDVPDLHHIYGREFEKRYCAYEEDVRNGKIKVFKQMPAAQLWKKMLTRLFETGHPWITFKDAANVRSPQDHCGVIHSSNLCTEIMLNTSATETAVCNLGSINLGNHIIDGALDKKSLQETIVIAVRMLDNVIDINFYPTKEAYDSNIVHRPIGLGIMGLQDAFFKLDYAFDDECTLEFADQTMEFISYHTILASSVLAKERGAYKSYPGSKWSRNIFPLDTLELLEAERGMKISVNRNQSMDWTPVREHVQQYGMRNSNTMAIAPTATISNIVGCFPSIEPIYKNLYVKANMNGEFTVVNNYLVNDLKKLGLWNDDMLDKIKYFDGNISMIPEIPERLKHKHKEAFEIDAEWLVKLTAVRAKWIDQSQSHNVFMAGVSGQKLQNVFLSGWHQGVKSFYYLRTLGASQIEKSTLDAQKYGFTQKRQYQAIPAAEAKSEMLSDVNITPARACGIEDPSCEACQ